MEVRQHDGSMLRLRKLKDDYDPTDRLAAMNYMQSHAARGKWSPGCCMSIPLATDLHLSMNTMDVPLASLGPKDLCPGKAALDKINAGFR